MVTTGARPYDDFRTSRLGGNYVAGCSLCGHVCAYWDSEDLDDEGLLWHDCPVHIDDEA